MSKVNELEKFLYWVVSSIINLVIFTFMSMLLMVNVKQDLEFKPINLIIQEQIAQPSKEILQSGALDNKAKVKKGESSVPASIAPTRGDYPISTTKNEPSILSQLEERVKHRKNQQEGMKIVKEIGNIVASHTESGISISTTGTRKVLYTPEIPKIVSDEPLAAIRVRIWVEPSGIVSKVEILQRSGSSAVDRQVVNFVKGIRFEPINGDVQIGILTFKLRGG